MRKCVHTVKEQNNSKNPLWIVANIKEIKITRFHRNISFEHNEQFNKSFHIKVVEDLKICTNLKHMSTLKTHTNGWSFLHAFRSSDKRPRAIPDILIRLP